MEMYATRFKNSSCVSNIFPYVCFYLQCLSVVVSNAPYPQLSDHYLSRIAAMLVPLATTHKGRLSLFNMVFSLSVSKCIYHCGTVNPFIYVVL